MLPYRSITATATWQLRCATRRTAGVPEEELLGHTALAGAVADDNKVVVICARDLAPVPAGKALLIGTTAHANFQRRRLLNSQALPTQRRDDRQVLEARHGYCIYSLSW